MPEFVDATLVPFPHLVSAARLPTADAMRRDLRARGIDELDARVRVCVAATGKPTGVTLAASSGTPAFDAAAVRDVASWRYQPFRAPDDVKVCEQLTVRYVL